MRLMETPLVERAFQLALECTTLDEIRSRLKHEGYHSVDAYFHGSLRVDLKKTLEGRASNAADESQVTGCETENPFPDSKDPKSGGDPGRT